MRKLLLHLTCLSLIVGGLSLAGEVGNYPNATPVTGTERMLSDQGGITVDITPVQISNYLCTPYPLLCTGNTGSGLNVLANGPTMTLTNATGLPLSGLVSTSGPYMLGNSTGGSVVAMTTLPSALHPALNGDISCPVGTTTCTVNQAAGNFAVYGQLSGTTYNPPTNTFAPPEIDYTNVGGGGVVLVNGLGQTGTPTNGTYTNISDTSGLGTSAAAATIVIVANATSSITITTPGAGYPQSAALTFPVTGGTATASVRTTNNPQVRWVSSNGSSNFNTWGCYSSATTTPTRNFICAANSDSFAVERQWLNITGTGVFGTTSVLSSMVFGNSGDNPSYTFSGTGTIHGAAFTSQPTVAATADAGNMPYTLMQSGMPFISTQCTLTQTNAVLSACNALAQTWGISWMYFNASVITSSGTGSTAGYYAVNMTSTTGGSICSPVTLYSSGSPIAPSCSTLSTTNATTGTQTPPATITLGPNISLPGHALGLNGQLFCTASTAQTNDANTKTTTLKWGANSAGVANTTIAQGRMEVTITNSGSESAQSYQNINNSSAATMQANLPNNTALNFGAAQTISLSQTNSTPATDAMQITQFSCRVSPN